MCFCFLRCLIFVVFVYFTNINFVFTTLPAQFWWGWSPLVKRRLFPCQPHREFHSFLSSQCSIPISLFITMLHSLVPVHHHAPSSCPCSSHCSIPVSLLITMLHPFVFVYHDASSPCPWSSQCSTSLSLFITMLHSITISHGGVNDIKRLVAST